MSNSATTSDRPPIDRRRFLRNMGLLGAGITVSSLPLSFAGPAAAQAGGSRSLVCVFLAGGADSFNMFIPRDHAEAGQTHAVYSATRGDFAVPASQLHGIGDGAFGLHPSMSEMAAISGNNQLAVVTNVGPLARPTTRADVLAERSLPVNLFAHDAQQKLWQNGRPVITVDDGWGGAIAAAVANGAEVSPSFSLHGSNVWQNSLSTSPSRLSATVAIQRLTGYDVNYRGTIPGYQDVQGFLNQSLALAANSNNQFDQVAAETIRGSILATAALQEATADTAANDVGMDDINRNSLGLQLRHVARLIRNREALNMPRQVFFVEMGGWDTHASQEQLLPGLLQQLDQALGSFQRSMNDMGLADSVTTFTASDFGRTLTNNGDGTDHGWGGHAFVMGGAVQPGVYGTFPNYSTTNNPDDTGDGDNFAGRLIPTTSVSQYGATLARWMGLNESQLASAFPEVSNFATSDLGFL